MGVIKMQNNKEENLVSIITPVYNCEKLISETINCVLNQTYKNWEMLLVDDCSTDDSARIVKEFSKKDSRVKYIKLEKNSGAAVARNTALENSNGRFIAYLDSDDLWKSDKLEKQVDFMLKNNYAFTCTDYEKIDENGKSLNKVIKIPKKVNYNLYLRNTIIQTVGVMVDTKITGKEVLVMPNIRRRQDAATWCQILKAGHNCYALSENLSYYRVVTNSLSSNKFKAVKGTWSLYRDIEKLPLLKSCYCFVGYAFNAVKKRIYIKK
jgi:teichuronic acid biosynthesis glycosyltransferase TuaG